MIRTVKIIFFILDAVRYDVFLDNFSLNKLNIGYFKIFNNVFSASSWTLPAIVSLFSATYPFTFEKLSLKQRPCLLRLLRHKGFSIEVLNSGNAFIDMSDIGLCVDKNIVNYKKYTNYNIIIKERKKFFNNLIEKFDFVQKYSLTRNFFNDSIAVLDTYNAIVNDIYPYNTLTELLIKLENEVSNSHGNTFIYVHVMDTHHPWISLSKFKDKMMSILIATFIKYYNTGSLPRSYLSLMYQIYRESVKTSINFIKLFAEKIFNINDDVILIITSDHGEGFSFINKFDRFHEYYTPTIRIYNLFYDQLHIPLVFMTNYQKAEVLLSQISENEFLSSVDVLPLILYLVGMEKEIRKIGKFTDSIIPDIFKNRGGLERRIYSETPAFRRSFSWYDKAYSVISSEGYKLTVSPFLGVNLINIKKDRQELYNLRNPDVRKDLIFDYKITYKTRIKKSLSFSVLNKLRKKLF